MVMALTSEYLSNLKIYDIFKKKSVPHRFWFSKFEEEPEYLAPENLEVNQTKAIVVTLPPTNCISVLHT